jgi:hypothetical protein
MYIPAPMPLYPLLVIANSIRDCRILQCVFIGRDGPFYQVEQTQTGDVFWTFDVIKQEE